MKLSTWLTTALIGLTHAKAAYEGYVFAYFTGNDAAGENIYLAASNGNNALSWSELNGGRPILTSTKGTKGLRDPFLMRSHDGTKFYLLATDLSIASGTSWGDAVRFGSRYIEIWESTDLIHWSEQRHGLVAPPQAGMTWAPEAYYDSTIDKYIVFWASAIYADGDVNRTGQTYNRMLYATTSDFVTFSESQVWQDAGTSRIDSTVIQAGNVYHRFTKDEGAVTGCADIIQESSQSLRASLSSWKVIASCIGRKAGTQAVEGPTSFKSNPNDVNGDKYYLFVDEYGGRGYIPLETANITQPDWKISPSYSLPKSPRHGTVVSITAAELASLKGKSVRSERQVQGQVRRQTRSPVLAGYNADPNIAIFGGTAYIYPTSDGFDGWAGNTFYVWKSTDMLNWVQSKEPILTLAGSDGNVPWATGNAWAPTIIERDGTYFFYFSGQNPTYDRKTIGVATARSPEGPFTAQQKAMILNNEQITTGQAIDPAAFYDPQSRKYFLFWGNGNGLMAELNEDMISIKSGSIQTISGLTDFREGIFVNFRGGLYHLTYSVDDTGSENYRVGYATAKSVYGPWLYHGIILEKRPSDGILATGHSSIVQVPGRDEWYICYHRFHIPNGDGTHREVTIDKLSFGSNGLVQPVTPTLSSINPVSLS